jgi:DNA-binding NtrC family response regulator
MDEVANERFREDLYWRLNVVPIVIPPLRRRPEDVPQLVAHFLRAYSESNDRHVVHIQREALEAMQQYTWPGNVRELQNYVERAVVMADGDELTVELLPAAITGTGAPKIASQPASGDLNVMIESVVQQGLSQLAAEDGLHEKIVDRVERELISQVMQHCGQVQTKAATKLGINRNTLHKKLKDYKLD